MTDREQLTEVTLHRPTDETGLLTSEWVQVFNCLNNDGGPTAMPMGFPFSIQFCNETQTVLPDADGHYLSIAPPDDETDPNDPFAEIMMYHHVNRAHDYFKDSFEFTELDFPLPALVNVQIRTDPVEFGGFIGTAGLTGGSVFPMRRFPS